MNKRLSIFLLLASMVCCKNRTVVPHNESFTREIPHELEERGSLFESLKFIRDSLRLDTLENGYDSMEIRIWMSMALSSQSQIVIIKNHKGNWSATSILFTPVHNDIKQDSLLYYTKESVNLVPKSSWDSFIKKLKDHQILTLPDQDKLIGYDHPHDGGSVEFEISSKYVYRLYSYHAPGVNLHFPEAKNVEAILDLIKQEFGVKLIYNL